jgi:uncharacterized protein VirK/YbjX
MLKRLLSGFISDSKAYSLQVAALRVLRSARILGMPTVLRQLMSNPAYQRHVALVAKDDPLFFLSHKYYLAKGLTTRIRGKTVLQHYAHEIFTFDNTYLEAVYGSSGLVLWSAEKCGSTYDIRLMYGNDVLYEGGASLVAHADGKRIAVMSYSNIMTNDFLSDPMSSVHARGQKTIFIARKHLTSDRDYQRNFNEAFDRAMIGQFCFAALSAIALAQKYQFVIAISPNVHPACTPEIERHLKATYSDFWESLSGTVVSSFGYVIDLPMQLTPLESLDPKSRKRAIARRAHIESVRQSAHAVISQRLLQKEN